MDKLTCLDLFSGAGGLSEGFLQTNKYSFLGHIEWEKPMVDTLRNNLVKRWGYSEEEAKRRVIHFDIQRTDELFSGIRDEDTRKEYEKSNSEDFVNNGMSGIIGENVDVVIGGPPCQAYSIAGRAQDPNSMKYDYRNYLFESFVKIVQRYRPKVFVFENVPGMLSACPGDTLVINRICKAFDEIGYRIRKPEDMRRSVYSAADFQVPQDRHRVIIFGVSKESGLNVEDFYAQLDELKSAEPHKTVRDAIGNMPKFIPLSEPYKKGRQNISHRLVGNVRIPNHEARYHNQRDIQVFKKWISNKMNDIPNAEKLRFYREVSGKESNHNKYRSLDWDKPSPTIVSHLYKDGLMFIHPDVEQLRSITMREAALLQTFPMDFEFVGSTASCFKMIGNAVPVLFAKNIAQAVCNAIEGSNK